MSKCSIGFEHVHGFSSFDKHYVNAPSDFSPFISAPPTLQSGLDQIDRKKSSYTTSREMITGVISSQYRDLGLLSDERRKFVEQLQDENTFTVITAHQPSLLTGPLYFIHKIISAIVTAEEVNNSYTEGAILPLFIIGGEDHDFDEMNHLYFKSDRLEWQDKSAGNAVGRISTRNIVPIIEKLAKHLKKSFYGEEITQLMQESFNGNRTVGQAMQYFLLQLFKDEQLLIVQMDDRELKRAFIPHIKKEVLEQPSRAWVEQSQKELQKLGYGEQALARDINFFYLHEGQRRRITYENNMYYVLDSEIEMSAKEMSSCIEKHPERFSPNVVMRPVYQEFIFPNLIYVGGGGELAYWMERKRQFSEFSLPLPLLVRRHSATLITNAQWGALKKFGLPVKQWFSHLHDLEKGWLENDFSGELDFTNAYQQMHDAFDGLQQKMSQVDPTLEYSTEAARVDALKTLDRLKKKMRQALKEKHKIKHQRLLRILNEIAPEGSLQERRTNFLEYYERRGPELFQDLKSAFKPFKSEMLVITTP
jgi:bacillithiol biosynthesis cysteine-adding enzyme BshC